jgi:predicted DNA-binding transcriptional regulator AlpA
MTIREVERRRALLTGIAPVHHPAQQPSITPARSEDPAIKAVPVQRRPRISARGESGKSRNHRRHRDRGGRGDGDGGDGDDGERDRFAERRVMTLSEFCRRNRISKPTLWRMRRDGTGPATVRLGLRRVGIRFIDEKTWQESRTGA